MIDKDANLSAFQIAEVYALRGQPEETFAWLERAWSKRDPGLSLLLMDAFIVRYKDDPRFRRFLSEGRPTAVGHAGRGQAGDMNRKTHHSAFCTCSRICSISTFMSTALRVVSRSCDFDESVFASRLSSCMRKSRRRPAASLPPITRRTSSM